MFVPKTTDTLGYIVSKDHRYAHYFAKKGIDFCCQGHLSFEEICQNIEIDADKTLQGMTLSAKEDHSEPTDYTEWSANALISHIVEKYHQGIREDIPAIQYLGEKVLRVHGDHHPELYKIVNLFQLSTSELLPHMELEEGTVFPQILNAEDILTFDTHIPNKKWDSILYPIQQMVHEHHSEGERFHQMRNISNNFTPPEDACQSFRTFYSMLNQFEEYLHEHIHLENSLLFPLGLRIEAEIQDLIKNQDIES